MGWMSKVGLGSALALVASLLLAPASPAQAALVGSVVVYQCGTSVCAIDPDKAGTNRVIAANATPAGVTRDGKTAGIVDRATNEIRQIPLAAGGFTRTMARPGAADPPDFASISDSGNVVSWTWWYGSQGWYGQVQAAGQASYQHIASSTMQLNLGWKGDEVLASRRGTSTYGARICIERMAGTTCDVQLAGEPINNQQIGFPDIAPNGTTIVGVRGTEDTGFGLPYYGPLHFYNAGNSNGPVRALTTGRDAHPEFSYEGSRVVFEREKAGIYVVNTDGTGLRKIADGSMPFWGGPRHEEAPPNQLPKGAFDAVNGGAGTVRVAGWGFDPDVPSQSISAAFFVGGKAGAAGVERFDYPSHVLRPDVNTAHKITGNHGFIRTLTTRKRGTVPVCMYLLNVPAGTNVLLGCRNATITAPATTPTPTPTPSPSPSPTPTPTPTPSPTPTPTPSPTPTPGPTPGPTPIAPTVALQIDGIAKARKGLKALSVRVSCPSANAAGCAGKITIKTKKKVKIGSKVKRLRLAVGSYQVAVGGELRLEVKVSAKGKKYLARHRAVKALVQAKATSPAGLKSSSVEVIKHR